MYVSHYKEIFSAAGILWSSSKKISKEIIVKISQKYIIKEIIILELKDNYKEFIIDCYKKDEEVMSDGYIDEKIERLLKDQCNQVVYFLIDIESPQYKYNKSNNKDQCIQARKIKEDIRKEFSKKINNYFLDNIIHLADNKEETKILEDVLKKYEIFIKKRYTRNGKEKNIYVKEENKNKRYLDIVKSINSIEER